MLKRRKGGNRASCPATPSRLALVLDLDLAVVRHEAGLQEVVDSTELVGLAHDDGTAEDGQTGPHVTVDQDDIAIAVLHQPGDVLDRRGRRGRGGGVGLTHLDVQ